MTEESVQGEPVGEEPVQGDANAQTEPANTPDGSPAVDDQVATTPAEPTPGRLGSQVPPGADNPQNADAMQTEQGSRMAAEGISVDEDDE